MCDILKSYANKIEMGKDCPNLLGLEFWVVFFFLVFGFW
jgi:hypothetical protein